MIYMILFLGLEGIKKIFRRCNENRNYVFAAAIWIELIKIILIDNPDLLFLAYQKPYLKRIKRGDFKENLISYF